MNLPGQSDDAPVDFELKKLKRDLSLQTQSAKLAKIKAEQAMLTQNLKAQKRAMFLKKKREKEAEILEE